MKVRLIGAAVASIALLFFSLSARAALESRLGGLAYYDTASNLTWLADANAAGARMNWADANTWAASLNIDGVTGWRLPDTVQPDASCDFQDGGSYGFNCTGSEMGNLFYNVLGGSAGSSITTTHNANYDLFSNIQSYVYWSATPDASGTGTAWYFSMGGGNQDVNDKANELYAWAVHTGDVSVVPVPAAIWLFASGLLGLGAVRRKGKDRNA